MNRPKIKTAIPQQRYRVGGHQAVVLGEIESGDERRYRYVLALVPEGQAQPVFYVTAEKNSRRVAETQGAYRLRAITGGLDEELGSSDRWGDLDAFAQEALSLAAEALGLAGEPERLL